MGTTDRRCVQCRSGAPCTMCLGDAIDQLRARAEAAERERNEAVRLMHVERANAIVARGERNEAVALLRRIIHARTYELDRDLDCDLEFEIEVAKRWIDALEKAARG